MVMPEQNLRKLSMIGGMTRRATVTGTLSLRVPVGVSGRFMPQRRLMQFRLAANARAAVDRVH